MTDVQQLTEEQKFYVAMMAGCELEISVGKNHQLVLRTKNKVGMHLLEDGRIICAERKGE